MPIVPLNPITRTPAVPDPTITETEVVRGQIVRPGDRVKHFAQRYTGSATATVVGFCAGDDLYNGIYVLVQEDDTVEPDGFAGMCGRWAADRVEPAEDRFRAF